MTAFSISTLDFLAPLFLPPALFIPHFSVFPAPVRLRLWSRIYAVFPVSSVSRREQRTRHFDPYRRRFDHASSYRAMASQVAFERSTGGCAAPRADDASALGANPAGRSHARGGPRRGYARDRDGRAAT